MRNIDIEPAISDREILRSNIFTSFPSVGQIVEGHCLVMPKRDILNLSQLTAEEKFSLVEFVNIITAKLENVYGSEVLIFEQGAVEKNSKVGCGIDIAHLHLVPFKHYAEVLKKFESHHELVCEFNNLENAFSFLNHYAVPYILIGSPSSGYKIFHYLKVRESQIVRKYMAEIVKVSVWDWKQITDNTLLWRTYNKMVTI